MKYYTETIPTTLAEKLKEKGMPMMPCLNITQTGSFSNDGGIHFYYLPTFAECFDWLIERGIYTIVHIDKLLLSDGTFKNIYYPFTDKTFSTIKDRKDTWHEAANAAIEKALTLI